MGLVTIIQSTESFGLFGSEDWEKDQYIACMLSGIVRLRLIHPFSTS
ncbi:MAG: hypothetical protein HYX66_06090 [Ignavibacteria bacterium]|nr:hypothetical protein [Ignavibacteria bacterium]